MPVPFWINDINILLNKKYLFDVWPLKNMTYEAKLNAISRFVILLSILGFICTSNFKFLFVGFITLLAIIVVYKTKKNDIIKSINNKEGFVNKYELKTLIDPISLEKVLKDDFHHTTKKNPMGNMLLTDIVDNVNKKSAPPSFNPEVHGDIINAVKKQTQYLNPTINNTNEQLYGNLKDNFDLDNSMRAFYPTANTRVVNDQGAFSKFLYGDMPSGKSSDADGAFSRTLSNQRHILI